MSTAREQIKAFVARAEHLDDELAAINSDKSHLYQEAKGAGLDVAALKAVVAYRRKREKHGAEKIAEQESVFATYLHAVEGGADEADPRAPARARENIEEFPPEPTPSSTSKGDPSRPQPQALISEDDGEGSDALHEREPISASSEPSDDEMPAFLRRTRAA